MAEFLDDILEDRMNILTMDAQTNNLVDVCKQIRETPFDELTTDLKRELMFILLKQLQPFLSAANLSHGIKPDLPMDPTGVDDTQVLTVQDEMQSLMKSGLNDTTPTISELVNSQMQEVNMMEE